MIKVIRDYENEIERLTDIIEENEDEIEQLEVLVEDQDTLIKGLCQYIRTMNVKTEQEVKDFQEQLLDYIDTEGLKEDLGLSVCVDDIDCDGNVFICLCTEKYTEHEEF